MAAEAEPPVALDAVVLVVEVSLPVDLLELGLVVAGSWALAFAPMDLLDTMGPRWPQRHWSAPPWPRELLA